MAERTGLVDMVKQASAGEAEPVSDAEQLALLGLEIPINRSVAGRPPGRRNLRNQRIADYLLAKYRDPLEGLVQMAALGVEELAAALGCNKLEAFAEKRQCMIAALPYLHQRQAIAIDATNRNIVHLSIHEGFAPGPREDGDALTMALSGGLAEIVDAEPSDMGLPEQDT